MSDLTGGPPPPTPQAGASDAAAMGVFAIAGYAFADWLSLPGLIALGVGLATAYGAGFLDAQKEWNAYYDTQESLAQLRQSLRDGDV